MATKTVYNYHPRSGEFLGLELAHESPLEPGVWHMPAHATDVPPPATIPSGHRARFDGAAWSVFELARKARSSDARLARRLALERLSRHTDAAIESCYVREAQLRQLLSATPDDPHELDAFDPAALWE